VLIYVDNIISVFFRTCNAPELRDLFSVFELLPSPFHVGERIKVKILKFHIN